MSIPSQILEETQKRYQQRQSQRQNHLEQLEDSTKLLTVDSQERIRLRLERLGQNPLAKTMMAESQGQSPQEMTRISDQEFRQLVQEVALGQNDLMGIRYLDFALNSSRSIGRVLIQDSRQRLVGYGTGFLVSPRLLLTNNHVLPNAQTAGFSAIEFNYQTGISGNLLPTFSYRLDPSTFFLTHAALDYTLVHLVPNQTLPDPKTFGWNRLIEAQGKVIIGEYINIIQHPGGQPKQLALRENRLIDIFDNFLHYQTDTAPGSSGSPVYNDQWEVVGLHHSGVPKKDSGGNILATNGQRWQRTMGEDQIAWQANEGVRISKILQHLNQQVLDFSRAALRRELLEAEPILPNEASLSRSSITTPMNEPTNANPLSITWTIPLQVSVSLGSLGSLPPASQTPVVAHTPLPGTATDTPNDTDLDQAIALDKAVQEDLALLERTRSGQIPYFDATADQTERNDYYGSLIQEVKSLSKAELFKRLSQLVQQTHKIKLSYAPSRQLYAWVDLRPDFKIRSIYSELEFEPEQIIREDFRIDLERLNRTKALMQEATTSFSNLSTELDLLEAQLPYNCEHVVPQSWFNKKDPMRGDLHHLFACEVACNSFRGNTPFFDFADFQEALRDDCGKSDRQELKFEPENGKGAVARATLYFLLRYPGQINNREQEYTKERLKTLLKWHQDYPLKDEYEFHRNRAISKKQGNRNPLIDFPEWADKIDFTQGLGIATG
jgi:endonuclease G, mitochondrial